MITKIYDGKNWKSIEIESKTLILNNIDRTLATNTGPLVLPFFASDTVTINNGTYYTVTDYPATDPVGVQIKILKAGNYLISAELSVNNMPAGDTKYELTILMNGNEAGYLSQGYASIPNIIDERGIGITGALMYVLAADNTINIKYILDANVPLGLNAPFLKIGITKL